VKSGLGAKEPTKDRLDQLSAHAVGYHPSMKYRSADRILPQEMTELSTTEKTAVAQLQV